MIFNPYFWAALAVLLAAAYVGGCTKGAHQVEVKWDQDKAMRAAEMARIVKENADATAAASAKSQADLAKSAKDFAALKSRNVALDAKLRAVIVDHDLLDRLQLAVDTANAKAGDAKGISPAPPGPSATTSGDRLAGWFDEVAGLYRECRERVAGMIGWYDSLAK